MKHSLFLLSLVMIMQINFIIVLDNQDNQYSEDDRISKFNNKLSIEDNNNFKLRDSETTPLKENSLPTHLKQNQEQIEFGSILRTLRSDEYSGEARSITYSPTGRYIAIGTWGGLHVWDLIQDKLLWEYGERELFSGNGQKFDNTESIAFSLDEKFLFTAGWSGPIHILNMTTGDITRTLIESENFGYQHILISKDGSELIASIINGTEQDGTGLILFWDINSGRIKPEKSLSFPHRSRDIALSPNGQILATGDGGVNVSNGNVTIWNLTTKSKIHTFTGHQWLIRTLSFSQDGTLLASGGGYHTTKDVHIWNITNLQEILFSTHELDINLAISMGFSQQNSLFYFVDSSGDSFDPDYLTFYKIPSNPEDSWEFFQTITINAYSGFHALSPDGNILAVSNAFDEAVLLINIGTHVSSPISEISHTTPISTLAFGHEENSIISSDSKGKIILWNKTISEKILSFNGSKPTINGLPISTSPDRKWLASGDNDGFVRFYNITDGEEYYVVKNFDSSILSLAYSSNGHWLATGHGNGKITLWNVSDVSNVSVFTNLTGHLSAITSLAFSLDANLLASGSLLSTVFVWNVSTGSILFNLPGHKDRISSLQFSSDRVFLVSGSWDKTLILWDVNSGLIYKKFINFAEINTLIISPDDKHIFTGNSDGMIKIWDIEPGIVISSLRSSTNEISNLAYSPINKILISGGFDGKINFWDLNEIPNDSDGDGMDDNWEENNGLDQFSHLDYFDDPDEDGLMNGIEYLLKSNPNRLDTDNDTIFDRWEFLYYSDPLIMDQNSDADGDLISNLYEFESGLNGLINDNSSDMDDDGLTNFQEFIYGSWANSSDSDNDGITDSYEMKMSTIHKCFESEDNCRFYNYIDLYDSYLLGWYYTGLDPLCDDSSLDLDNDGIPNLWEFQKGLLANTSDAKLDPDFDLVNNLDEYRGGSDPHDFWSVPLASFSFFHLLVYSLIIFVGISTVVFFLYKPVKKRNFLTKFNAPDYQTAEKLYQAGFPDYETFLQTESKAKLILEEAYSDYNQGNSDDAIQKYTVILDLLPFSGNHVISAESSLRLALIYQDKGKLGEDNIVFKNIPSDRTDPKLIIFSVMLKALHAETLNNWGEAEKLWLQALDQKYLLIDYELISRKSLTELAFRTWFFEQTDLSNNLFLSRLEEWQEACQKYDEMGSLCHLFILRARYSLASYKFNEVEDWLNKGQDLVIQINLPYYSNLIRKSTEDLLLNRERIEKLSLTEQLLLPEDKERLLKQYIRRAVLILQEE